MPVVSAQAERDRHRRFRSQLIEHLVLWVTLMGLTGLSLWLAYVPLGHFNLVVALAIATGQVVLLGLFFLHLKDSSKLILMTAASAFVFLTSMFVLTLNDLFTRV